VSSLREFLLGLSRPVKKVVALAADLVCFAICVCLTDWLLLSAGLVSFPTILVRCAAVSLFAVFLAWSQGLYKPIFRFVGFDVVAAGAKIAAGSAVFGAMLLYFSEVSASPARWAFIFGVLSFVYIFGSRYVGRYFLLKRGTRTRRDRVIIYGAGNAGAQLAIGLREGDRYLPVAIIDDDPSLCGATVKGLTVSSPARLEWLIEETGATRVLLAIPGASRRQRRMVLERLSEYPVHVQTMPGLSDLVSGQAKVDDLSEVDVNDLLGRDPVPPVPDLLSASISGKNVLVTGAGGSIGSELCRQIALQNPKTLVLFELSEFALYEIEKELAGSLRDADSDCRLIALLGSVDHKEHVQEVMATFGIETVFHAAAYKHVPVVEQNILEGVRNNVFGTYYLAKAAVESGVGTFVLISTDKAVSPTNVMGATKRVAELILQTFQDLHPDICFCMVRFGNVLESSGSVVPLFRDQIRAGGPVTVTHREIIRYFMTIPEAAELVLQASAMAKGGDVFVLDMGEPVRIADLAARMIKLMGLSVCDEKNPEGDIAIEFTGLRPAEKLYEELLIGTDVSGTRHPRILRANEEKLAADELATLINQLHAAMQAQDRIAVRSTLKKLVSGYTPSNGIEDLVWSNRKDAAAQKNETTVVEFPKQNS
jgi:FlaA1/EpsC-like NDP-sugar epimerase